MLGFAQPAGPVYHHGAAPFPDAGADVARQAPQEGAAVPGHAAYWPGELLNGFVLKMAAAGHCVNTDMMLGHRLYAEGRLAAARASGDAELAALAARLQAYFDTAASESCRVVARLALPQRGRLLLV